MSPPRLVGLEHLRLLPPICCDFLEGSGTGHVRQVRTLVV